MTAAPMPPDEQERIETLRTYAILDTPPERCFDRITRLAARQFNMPIALVSLVDENRQWFKSNCGLDARETPRNMAFCAHAILKDDVLVVTDASIDPMFHDNPLVTGDPKIRFYAGAPLVAPNGTRIGTLCLIDMRPRHDFDEQDKLVLKDLADIITDEMEMRLAAGYALLSAEKREIPLSSEHLCAIVREAPTAKAMFDRNMNLMAASRSWLSILQTKNKSLIGRNYVDLLPNAGNRLRDLVARALRGEVIRESEEEIEINGRMKWMRVVMHPWQEHGNQISGIVMNTEDITAQKTASLELEHNRAFLEAVLENVEDGIFACDVNGDLNFLNRAGRRLFGLDEGAPLPKDWADCRNMFHADGVAALKNNENPLMRAYTGEQVSGMQMEIAPLHGPRRKVLASGCAINDNDGNRLGAVVSVHDITERVAAETSLRRQKAELQLILDNVPVRIWYKDDKNRILRLNKAAAQSIDMDVKEAAGANAYDLFPELAKQYHEDDLAVIASGQPRLGVVEEYTSMDGSRGWVRVDKIPYTDPDTGERFIFAAASDVTAVTKAEEDLRESEASFRFLYNNTPALLHSIDPDGRIVNVSDYWLETLGYSRDEVIGRPSTDFQTAESASRSIEQDMPNFLRDGSCKNNACHFVKKSGEIVDVLLSSIAQRDQGGKLVSGVTVLTDVTHLKALEAQLVQAQKMEAVGQLTGGLAHDFNNLLAIVIGNLQLLERAVEGNEKVANKAASALNAAQRGADLTQRLLAFSRRQPLDSKVIDPNQLVLGIHGLLGGTFGKDIVLKTSLANEIWPVQTDINQLETAILNLAVNARDAMCDGGVLTITTTMESVESGFASARDGISAGDYVVISVTDTGCGMSPEIIRNIFEPFFTTKETGSGTGLGMSMVYGFAKQSGGHVDIRSEPGRGSTIRLYLPRSYEAVDAGLPIDHPVCEIAGGSETVLVVEDEDEVRNVAVALLEDLGYHVLNASNAHDALKILGSRADIALLFTDIMMPGLMNGADLATRAREQCPELKIVYASGFADASILHQGQVRMKGELLLKPYQHNDLARALRNALDSAALRPQRRISA